jgi:hypothetical protein
MVVLKARNLIIAMSHQRRVVRDFSLRYVFQMGTEILTGKDSIVRVGTEDGRDKRAAFDRRRAGQLTMLRIGARC